MNARSKMRRMQGRKVFIFFIQTVVPFLLPFLFEVPPEYISKSVQVIAVVFFAAIDLFFIYLLNEKQKQDQMVEFRNKIARDAYSNVYELNERKRNYIVNCSYRQDFSLPEKVIPYNIHEYIVEICNSFKNVISQITEINKEYISVSFIYRYKYRKEKEPWRWIVGKEQTMQTPLDEFVNTEETVYYTLINEKDTVVFYNDKKEMAEYNKYYMSARDKRHNKNGSIFGVQLMFSNNAKAFVEGILIISTYGERFISDNNPEKVNQLKRLIIDDLFPNYQRLLETELGMLYLQHRSKPDEELGNKNVSN